MDRALFKKMILSSVIIISFLFTSCASKNNEPTNSENSTKVAEEHNDAKFAKSEEKDAQFLVDAAAINLEEIQLGNLAVTKGATKEVRDLGKMMADIHEKAQADLVALAGQKGISVPTTIPDESMKNYNSIKDKNNTDFDKKYTDMMVDGHKDAISKFETASTECQDADIRNWAAKMLPSLREHLDQSMNTKEKLASK